MPIDPRIPLQAEGIKAPNMLESASRVQSLRNMAQQNQLGAQQLEQNQLGLDETRKRLQDTEHARRIMAEEKDARKAIRRIMNEVGPGGVEAAKSIAQFDAAVSTMDENDLKLTGQRLQMIGSALNPIREMPEEQRAAAYDAAYKQLVANGIVNPEDPQAKIPAAYPGAETLDMMANSAVSVENQYKSAVASQRAQSYAANIASLEKQRQNKSNIDWVQYALDVEEMGRKLASDQMLDARERQKIESQLRQHRETLAQRAKEEAGRNRRFDAGEANDKTNLQTQEQGLMDRLKFRENAIAERQQALLKDFTPAQITGAYEDAMKLVAGKDATFEDMSDDEIEAMEVMAEQALKLESARVGKTEGKKLLGIRYGRDVQVTPGQPVGPRNEARPSRTTVKTTTERPASQAKPAPPKVGEIRDGYRFKGGNPADPNSWEKVR